VLASSIETHTLKLIVWTSALAEKLVPTREDGNEAKQ